MIFAFMSSSLPLKGKWLRASYSRGTEVPYVIYRDAVAGPSIGRSQNEAFALRRDGGVAAGDLQFRCWGTRTDPQVAGSADEQQIGTTKEAGDVARGIP